MSKEHTYILGEPITTPIGTAKPIKVSDYDVLSKYMGSIFIDKPQVVKILTEVVEQDEVFQPFLDFAKEVDFLEFVNYFNTEQYQETFLYEFYSEQKKLFEYIFGEDVFDKIESMEQLKEYRKLIIEMNDISYKPPNPNPELARLDRLKQKLIEMKGDGITFEAMYTSVLINSTVPPNGLTLYQFNKVFDRIGHFKSYDTSTLFKTVDQSGKLDISPWYKTTEDEKQGTITQEQLDRARKLKEIGGLESEL